MPVGLQRWPLNETLCDPPSSPQCPAHHPCSKSAGRSCCCYCATPQTVKCADQNQGGQNTAQALHKQLDALKRLNRSLEKQFVKCDGKTERAKLRLKEEQRAANRQRKQFSCIVERVNRFACCPDQDNGQTTNEECPKWQPPNFIIKDVDSNNRFKIEEDEAHKIMGYPNYCLGYMPDYAEELINAHVPNYETTDSAEEECQVCHHKPKSPCSGTHSNTGSKVGTSSLFGDQHITLDEKGKCVVITNKSQHDVDLGGHWVIQELYGCRVAAFRLPCRVSVPSMTEVTVWANGSEQKRNQPPCHFVYADVCVWCTEGSCTTILCNCRGQAIAWTTVVGIPPPTPQKPICPYCGSSEEPQIDVLRYLSCVPRHESMGCNHFTSKHVPFPPLCNKILNRPPPEIADSCCSSASRIPPIPELPYAGAPASRLGSMPLIHKLEVCPCVNDVCNSCNCTSDSTLDY